MLSERRLFAVLKDEAWSVACSMTSWEVSLCDRLGEFLDDGVTVHVVRFTRTDRQRLELASWVDGPKGKVDGESQPTRLSGDVHQHPGVRAVLGRGTHSPIRLSDVVDLPRFRDTDFFQEVHAHPRGTRFASAAALLSTSRELVLLGAHSTKKDLSSDHMVMLGMLQRVLSPALVIRRELAQLAGTSTEPDDQPAGDEGPWRWGRVLPSPVSVPRTNTDYWPTRREQQVLGLLVLGLTSRQIARRMEITERTVRKHLESVYRKADLTGRAAAAAWWERRGRW